MFTVSLACGSTATTAVVLTDGCAGCWAAGTSMCARPESSTLAFFLVSVMYPLKSFRFKLKVWGSLSSGVHTASHGPCSGPLSQLPQLHFPAKCTIIDPVPFLGRQVYGTISTMTWLFPEALAALEALSSDVGMIWIVD